MMKFETSVRKFDRSTWKGHSEMQKCEKVMQPSKMPN